MPPAVARLPQFLASPWRFRGLLTPEQALTLWLYCSHVLSLTRFLH